MKYLHNFNHGEFLIIHTNKLICIFSGMKYQRETFGVTKPLESHFEHAIILRIGLTHFELRVVGLLDVLSIAHARKMSSLSGKIFSRSCDVALEQPAPGVDELAINRSIV